MDHAEIIVVGAGLAGSAVAARVAEGAGVLVLEQGAQAGAEASAQNAGMIRRASEDPVERRLAIRTGELLAEADSGWPGGAPSRVTGAVLAMAHHADHLSDAVAHLRAAGVPVEACDEPTRVAPALAGARLARAWYLPQARVADAHGLVSGFLALARDRGARVRTGAVVQRLLVQAGRVVGVQTPDGPILGDGVVLAAGAWSARLAAEAGLDRRLVPLRRTLLHSEPHALSRPDHPWCWIDDEGIYAKPEGGGWLVSGCDERVDPPSPGPGSSGGVEPAHRALAIDKLRRHMPALADARLSRGWSGLRTFAPDRRPVLGADPELPGLWWAAGLGGYGVTTCMAVGEVVGTWLLGGEVSWLRPADVSPARPMPGRWPIRPDGTLGGSRLVDAR